MESIVGRVNETRRIFDSVSSQDVRCIIVYGSQFIGKTLLLKTLANEWHENNLFRTVYHDLAKNHYQKDEELVSHLTDLIMGEWEIEVELAGVGGNPTSTVHNRLNRWRTFLNTLSEENQLLLILDSFEHVIPSSLGTTSEQQTKEPHKNDNDLEEFIFGNVQLFADDNSTPDEQDSLEPSSTNGQTEEPNLFLSTFLPELIESEHIKLIIGTHIVDLRRIIDLFPSHSDQIRTIRLGFLDKDGTERLIQTEDLDDLVTWSNPEAVDRVWQLTNGHPYLVRVLCAAVSDMIFQDIGEITKAVVVQPHMVDGAIRTAEDAFEPLFENWWEELVEGEQLILTSIAQAYPNSVSADYLQIILNDLKLSNIVLNQVSEKALNETSWVKLSLRDLLAKVQSMDMVVVDNQTYRLSIQLFRDWVLKNVEISETDETLVQHTALAVIDDHKRGNASLQRWVRPILAVSSTLIRNILMAVFVILLIGVLVLLPFTNQMQDIRSLSTQIVNGELLRSFQEQLSTDSQPPSQPVVVEDSTGIENNEEVPSDTSDNVITTEENPPATEPNLSAQEGVALSNTEAVKNNQAEDNSNPTSLAENSVAGPSSPDLSQDSSTEQPESTRSPLTVWQALYTDSEVWSVAYSRDSKQLAVGLENGTILLWPLEADNIAEVVPRQLSGHTDAVYTLAFDPTNPNYLASASADYSIRLWNVETGENSTTLFGHTADVLSIAYNPDGSQLASGSADGTVRLWNVSSGTLMNTLWEGQGWMLSLAFSADGTKLAVGNANGRIQIWDPDIRILLHTFDAHTDWVSSVAFAPSGQSLASGAYDRSTLLWQIQERRAERLPDTSTEQSEQGLALVNSVAFHHSGKYLMAGYENSIIALWDVETMELLTTLSAHEEDIRSVAFSPDGLTAASGSLDGKVQLWQVEFDLQ
ncbi:MAG: WD40 repeat domain-containing protein [Chloroflexota bacterium]